MHLVLCRTKETVLAQIGPLAPHELEIAQMRFEFDWHALSDMEVYALRVVHDNEIVGLMALRDVPEELRIEIALLECSKENVGKSKKLDRIAGCMIAFACRMAFLRGYFGFVSLIPKTQLIEHYKTLYGFEQYGRHLAMDLDRSRRLIETYLNDEK